MKHKSELLHFGYVTQWETFVVQCIRPRHSSMTARLSRGSFSYTPRFLSVGSCPVWLLIRGYINQLCEETLIYVLARPCIRLIWLAYM
jgi:hypothetical protein